MYSKVLLDLLTQLQCFLLTIENTFSYSTLEYLIIPTAMGSPLCLLVVMVILTYIKTALKIH